MRTVQEDLQQEIDAIKDGITGITRLVAQKAYEKIVDKSPIWSGSYIMSHRIGINHRSSESAIVRTPIDPVSVPGFPDKCSYDEEVFLQEEASARSIEVNGLKEPGQIIISNETDYEAEVEHGLGYAPYEHGLNEALHVAEELCRRADRIPAKSMRIFKRES